MKNAIKLFKETNRDLIKTLLKSKLELIAFLIIYFYLAYDIINHSDMTYFMLVNMLSLVVLYIMLYFVMVIINLINTTLYYEFTRIECSINKLFSNEFGKLDIFDKEIFPTLKKYVKYHESPDNVVLYTWKYKVKTLKDTITYLLPTLSLLVVTLFKAGIIFLSKLGIDLTFIILDSSTAELSKYLLILIVYFEKLAEMSKLNNKIDLIIEIKNNVT